MATAYKYVKRDADSQVNWAEVGMNLTNTLKEENRVREEKKGAIESQAREYYKITNEVSKGENSDFNEFTLNASATLQDQMMLQYTLLKSGQLQPRQYTIMMQNLTDGTDQAFSLFENYNAEYARKMAMNNGNLPVSEQASEIQNWTMADLEGYGDFTNHSITVDPQTGTLSISKMIPDPNYKGEDDAPLIPDPDSSQTVQNLEKWVKGTYTKFDVNAAAEEFVEAAGIDMRVIKDLGGNYKAGTFESISDITQKTFGGYDNMSDEEKAASAKKMGVKLQDFESISLFQEAQRNYVKSKLSLGNTAAASVLLDFIKINPATKEPYKILNYSDGNKKLADKNPNIILLKNKSGRMVPVLSDTQQEVANRALTTQINYGLDYESKINVQKVYTEPRAETAAEINIGKGKETSAEAATLWNEIYYKTPEEKRKSLSALISSQKGLNNGLRNVNFIMVPDPDGGTDDVQAVEFTYGNPDKNRTGENAIIIGNNPSKEDWDRVGVEIHGISDATKLREAGGGYPEDSDYVGGFNGITSGRDLPTTEPVNFNQELSNSVSNEFEVIKKKKITDNNDLISNFQKAFTKYGITFSDPPMEYNTVNIKIKDGDPDGESFDTDQQNEMEAYIQRGIDAIPTEQAKRIHNTANTRIGEQKLSLKEWKKQNPNGTLDDFKKYFNK